MPLISLWVNTGGHNWERRLVDAANLPPPIPEDIPPPKPPPPKYRTDYRGMAEDYNRQIRSGFDRNYYSRLHAARLNFEYKRAMEALLGRIQLRQRGLLEWTLDQATDRDYIEAMFSLYGQGRTRVI